MCGVGFHRSHEAFAGGGNNTNHPLLSVSHLLLLLSVCVRSTPPLSPPPQGGRLDLKKGSINSTGPAFFSVPPCPHCVAKKRLCTIIYIYIVHTLLLLLPTFVYLFRVAIFTIDCCCMNMIRTVYSCADIHVHFVVYPSNCHAIIILCDVPGGGGSTGGVVREPRHRPLTPVAYRTASSTREFPPAPSRLAGALTNAVSDDRDPQQWYRPSL